MAQKVFVVEGRQFRTKNDYARALHDKEIIDQIKKETNLQDKAQLQRLKADLRRGRYRFMTVLGQDFKDEVDELLSQAGKKPAGRGLSGKKAGRTPEKEAGFHDSGMKGDIGAGSGSKGRKLSRTEEAAEDGEINDAVMEELRKREKRRKLVIALCSLAAAACLGYFGVYSYYTYRTGSSYEALNALKEAPVIAAGPSSKPQYTLDSTETEPKEVLDEYKNLLIKNKKLIGWLKIDDTNIDYPVMQTSDNEYYLDHNLNQEYDKNGSIFMDKDCDVLKPSTNFILYGHHMKSGKMFGNLHYYESEKYFQEHPRIQFDTIYEKGVYEIMYVFRSRVYSEAEIAFKYYQFIDANSEQEFDSYMEEMAAMSYYDTGVTAQYGDQLLTLSTCDYQEKDGRFVVVAKKIAKE